MFARLTITALTLAVAATPLAGQEHQHRETDSTGAAMQQMPMQQMTGGGMDMKSMMDGPFMMRVMRYSPANVLQHADVLGLSDQQRSSLADLSAPMRPMSPRMERMQRHMTDLEAAFNANDPDAIVKAFEPATAMMAHRVSAAARTRSLLTPVQREQLMVLPASHMEGGMMMREGMSSDRGSHHRGGNG